MLQIDSVRQASAALGFQASRLRSTPAASTSRPYCAGLASDGAARGLSTAFSRHLSFEELSISSKRRSSQVLAMALCVQSTNLRPVTHAHGAHRSS